MKLTAFLGFMYCICHLSTYFYTYILTNPTCHKIFIGHCECTRRIMVNCKIFLISILLSVYYNVPNSEKAFILYNIYYVCVVWTFRMNINDFCISVFGMRLYGFAVVQNSRYCGSFLIHICTYLTLKQDENT